MKLYLATPVGHAYNHEKPNLKFNCFPSGPDNTK